MHGWRGVVMRDAADLELPVADKIRTQLVDNLLGVFAALDNEDEVYQFLQDLCTVREISEMSQRLEVACMLADKQSYVVVQEATGASATTISRVSKCLNYGSGGYQHALAIIAQDEKRGEE